MLAFILLRLCLILGGYYGGYLCSCLFVALGVFAEFVCLLDCLVWLLVLVLAGVVVFCCYLFCLILG